MLTGRLTLFCCLQLCSLLLKAAFHLYFNLRSALPLSPSQFCLSSSAPAFTPLALLSHSLQTVYEHTAFYTVIPGCMPIFCMCSLPLFLLQCFITSFDFTLLGFLPIPFHLTCLFTQGSILALLGFLPILCCFITDFSPFASSMVRICSCHLRME